MPTGRALDDPRSLLLGAGRRVIEGEGPTALTSRTVAEASGVAKGVLHRYFTGFDSYLAALVDDEAARIRAITSSQPSDSVPLVVTGLLEQTFTPTMLGLVSIVLSRDDVRRLARGADSGGIPLLSDATTLLAGELEAMQRTGHLKPDADVPALALALVGTAHMLFAGELGGLPDRSAVYEVVESLTFSAV
jgi:AcrR family transcriptional regulator